MKVSELEKIIQDDIAEDQANLAEHIIIKEFLVKNEGKNLTKRFNLPEGYTFDFSHGMYYIKGRVLHLVSYDGTINSKAFEDYDACSGHASIKRIAQCEALLVPETFQRLLDLTNQVETAYKTLTESLAEFKKGEFRHFVNPPYYRIIKNFMTDEHFRHLG